MFQPLHVTRNSVLWRTRSLHAEQRSLHAEQRSLNAEWLLLSKAELFSPNLMDSWQRYSAMAPYLRIPGHRGPGSLLTFSFSSLRLSLRFVKHIYFGLNAIKGEQGSLHAEQR